MQPQDVPSVIDSAPSPQYAAAVERARELVREKKRGHSSDGLDHAYSERDVHLIFLLVDPKWDRGPAIRVFSG